MKGDVPPNPDSQHAWDCIRTNATKIRLLQDAPGREDKSRFLAAFAPHSAEWLNAIPNSSLGLKLDNNQLRIAVSTRIGAAVCQPHICNGCGQTVERLGCHGLSCRKSAGRHWRHHTVNDLIKRALGSAGFPAVLEPPGVSRDDGKRPDGMTLVPWRQGRSIIWDFTCVDTLATSNLSLTSQSASAAAEKAQRAKELKYRDVSQAFCFQAVAVETLGSWAGDGLVFIKEIGRRVAERSGEPRSTAFLLPQISMAIQRGNTAIILATLPVHRNLDEVLYIL